MIWNNLPTNQSTARTVKRICMYVCMHVCVYLYTDACVCAYLGTLLTIYRWLGHVCLRIKNFQLFLEIRFLCLDVARSFEFTFLDFSTTWLPDFLCSLALHINFQFVTFNLCCYNAFDSDSDSSNNNKISFQRLRWRFLAFDDVCCEWWNTYVRMCVCVLEIFYVYWQFCAALSAVCVLHKLLFIKKFLIMLRCVCFRIFDFVSLFKGIFSIYFLYMYVNEALTSS